ncbi:hypothetical protein AB0H20_31215 [Nocardia fluminea]|uniref:hypothetical protein n=1 Tax=Nocardia fluminea TaxID=134984 RepID=UPI0033F68033
MRKITTAAHRHGIATMVGGIGGSAVGCALGGIAGAAVAAATIIGLFGPCPPAAAASVVRFGQILG